MSVAPLSYPSFNPRACYSAAEPTASIPSLGSGPFCLGSMPEPVSFLDLAGFLPTKTSWGILLVPQDIWILWGSWPSGWKDSPSRMFTEFLGGSPCIALQMPREPQWTRYTPPESYAHKCLRLWLVVFPILYSSTA